MKSDVHFSAQTDEWATPQYVFDMLNEEFAFTLDAAASPENAKCARYYTKEQDGLKMPWGGGARFLQPAVLAAARMDTKGASVDAIRCDRGDAHTGPDRHCRLSRLHIQPTGHRGPFPARPPQVRRLKKLRAIPEHGGHFS